jgi:hypothetical protein
LKGECWRETKDWFWFFFVFSFGFFQMHDGTAIGRASLAELLAARWYSGKG